MNTQDSTDISGDLYIRLPPGLPPEHVGVYDKRTQCVVPIEPTVVADTAIRMPTSATNDPTADMDTRED